MASDRLPSCFDNTDFLLSWIRPPRASGHMFQRLPRAPRHKLTHNPGKVYADGWPVALTIAFDHREAAIFGRHPDPLSLIWMQAWQTMPPAPWRSPANWLLGVLRWADVILHGVQV